jgi:hypothetical protein
VYDFIERVHRRLGKGTSEVASGRAAEFQDGLNDFFVEQGIGWQMVDGEIITRGTEAFESAVHEAGKVLESAGRTTASDEIHEALADLSRRPKPDLTGAIQHGMAALECVARDACGDPKATLGELIKKNPNLNPEAAGYRGREGLGVCVGDGPSCPRRS